MGIVRIAFGLPPAMERAASIPALALLALIACGPNEAPSTHHEDRSRLEPTGSAAPKPFVFGEVRTVRSSALQQERTLNVHLPDGYCPDSAETYPVIYVLDGSADEDFPHIAGLVQYLNMYALLPRSIVVGIANVDRKHDFTHPTHNDSDKVWVPGSGGSEAFITFIGKELQPFIEKTYLTDGKRTLIGQSLGGLVAAEILFKQPGLFDDYILVSPSLWWDDGSLAKGADAWASAYAGTPKNIFIAMASDDDMMQDDVDRVRSALNAHKRPSLRWTYAEFPEETHATALHRAVYRGFEWLGGK